MRFLAAALICSALLAGLAWGARADGTGTPCDKLTSLTIPDVTVTAATAMAAGDFTPTGARAALTLPAFCRVQALARPTPDSLIKFEVWIPTTWNGKFEGVGTNGFDGSITYAAMATGLRAGYATVSSDMGHTGGELDFAIGHPEKLVDWAWRAMHVSTQAGKLILRDAMGRWPEHSYFVGCATGGHQALSEAQRFPDDYDGIVAGDPGNDRLHEHVAYLYSWLATHDADDKPLLNQTNLQLITRSAVALCDGDDGVKDGVIDDPRRCKFKPQTLLCKAAAADTCLTQVQIDAVQKIYQGARNPRTGRQLFPGFSIGSEGYGPAGNEGWGGFLINPKHPQRSEFYNIALLHNPDWDFHNFDFDKDAAEADEKLSYVSAINPDLSGFRDSGGKLILYAGWADPIAAGEDVVKDYEETVEKMGGLEKTKSFERFFMVPGMGHCSGGPGATSFDMLAELEKWVEQGKAPTRILASRKLEGGALRTRPLCPWPQVARWTGKGSSDDAANFICREVK